MVKFSKIAALAGSALVFAGMAFGQATCTANAVATNIIRAEGTTEQLAPMSFTCNNVPGGAVTTAGNLSIQVFLNPALPITSKVLDTGTGKTEAVAAIGGTTVYGTTSGSTLNFTGLAAPVVPACAAAPCGGGFTVTISNVRVNASSVTVGTGVPPNISATAFASGAAGTITPIALTFNNISFAQNGLAPAKIYKGFAAAPAATSTPDKVVVGSTGTNNFVICNAYSQKIDAYTGAASNTTPKSLAFIAQVNENFPSAFKTQADETSLVAVAAGAVAAGSLANTPATTGTRFKIVFANVPANVTILVPNAVLSSLGAGGAKAQLTASETGAFAAVTASTGTAVNGAPLAAVTVSGGTGVAVFEVTTSDLNNLDQFNVPVFINTTSNSVAGSATAVTATVSFAPIGSTNVPNFVSGSSTTTLTGSAFNICSTSLLFPFLTNQLGFDTGIAISNTSTDPFGSNGATAQAGTCSLNFYGAGAPSPANVTTPNVPTGTTYTQVLSAVAAGFQGYMIVQCNFQFAHGFAFVTDGVGANGGLSQGYLAGVIPDVNQVARGANPLSAAPGGSGETLGN